MDYSCHLDPLFISYFYIKTSRRKITMSEVIVTIPAYKEEDTIGNLIKEIKKMYPHYEVLVVDDGSPDKTAEIAEEAGAIVYRHHRNFGLAQTFRTEMKECLKMNADFIIHIDADGQYPTEKIDDLMQKLNEGYDLVLGSRFGKGKYSGSFSKKVGNKMFAKLFTRLLKMKITDTTTGFRAFTAEVAKLPIINNFTYTQEQLIRASKENFKICEIPIEGKPTKKSRLFKNPFDYAIKAWINILRIYRDYQPLKFFGILGLCFFIPGLLIGSRLFYWYITLGHINNKIPQAILCLMLIIIAVQVWIGGLIADKR